MASANRQMIGDATLVYDYLAETTMSIMSRARSKNPALGYATDFVDAAMAAHLAEILRRGIRVVANAGGLNPQACRDALFAAAARQGLRPKVALVTGDDVMASMPDWCTKGLDDMHTGEPAPPHLMSANAYVGAQGIARALDWGPMSSSPAAVSTAPWWWARSCTNLAGLGTTGTGWPVPPWRGM